MMKNLVGTSGFHRFRAGGKRGGIGGVGRPRYINAEAEFFKVQK